MREPRRGEILVNNETRFSLEVEMPAIRNTEIERSDEPFDSINLMEVPADQLTLFLEDWERRTALLKDAKGFISTTLEKSLLSGSKYSIIVISHWASYDLWLHTANVVTC